MGLSLNELNIAIALFEQRDCVMMRLMNWKNIIAEIQATGSLTQAEIAKACGTAQTTISSLINREGGEPGHSLGEKLMALHKKQMRKAKEAVANV
jgi:DNA-binding XRE family transcriptional regulator